jgi:hypothetical protein
VDQHPPKKKTTEGSGDGGVSMLDNIRRAELKRLLLHRRAATKINVHNMVEDMLAERVRWTSVALGRRMRLLWLVAHRPTSIRAKIFQ